jgi:hypothetical protein
MPAGKKEAEFSEKGVSKDPGIARVEIREN